MTKSLVEKFNDVKDYINNSEIPIQTVPLANHLGIEVFKANFNNDNISGKIQQSTESDSGFEIIVNKNHAINRRRFTIAHEIAHYVFHESLIGDGLFDDALYRSGLQSHEETQANGFAADILMPRNRLTEEINLVGLDVSKLADKFQVSEHSMSIRLGIKY